MQGYGAVTSACAHVGVGFDSGYEQLIVLLFELFLEEMVKNGRLAPARGEDV
jgi:hypothetical protein